MTASVLGSPPCCFPRPPETGRPHQVVDHQRLSAAGYCYSASAPPFVSAAASASLRMLRAEPSLVSALRKNAEFLHAAISKIAGLKVGRWNSWSFASPGLWLRVMATGHSP